MAKNNLQETMFAPAERADNQMIINQSEMLSGFRLLLDMLEAVPNGVVILNQERQIVYANELFKKISIPNGSVSLLGLRPGEALNCIHYSKMPGGCGTTEFCRTCGSIKAIIQAKRGSQNVQECRIRRTAVSGIEEPLDLRIWATPFQFSDEPFILFAVVDISNENRRRMLERLFFHDIGNTAGAIQGLADLVDMSETIEELKTFDVPGLLSQASHQLMDEITAQRQLMSAERGELTPRWGPVDAIIMIEEVIRLYQSHSVGEERSLKMDPKTKPTALVSDLGLLKRVIGNLVKNALEASKKGETVIVGCDTFSGQARFWVHNPSYMPRRIQLQVFQRSFSTKGKDRGLGTYSIKLFTEQYLQGNVSFRSDKEKGTIFVAMYPLKPAVDSRE